MNYPEKKWKILVIHHSHTDIGYTDRQEKIEKYHVEFIKQAIEINEESHLVENAKWEGFRWTCETFWAVERFLEKTDLGWHERLKQALQRGELELSATYLNMTELIDNEVLTNMTSRAVEYARSIEVPLNSAMTADINGYAWGYAECLAELGIENLFSCVHTHHGMFPAGRKQIPFWWETPKGKRILVWNGDHYNLGNELGIASKANLSYVIQDEFIHSPIVPNQWERAEERISRYLCKLEEEGYPYRFVPVMVSGLMTDNAPPNGAIIDFIKQWNEVHGNHIEIEMTTLSQFFALLRNQSQEIPVYKGDWPDWWADGVASTPMHTQIFREAQRTLRKVKRLDPDAKLINSTRILEAEYNLMLYAEHTWGYSSSVTEPWNPLVQSLGVRKEAYASQAHRIVFSALDDILQTKGEAPLASGRTMSYKVINPFPYEIEDYAQLFVDSWELPLIQEGLEVIEPIGNNKIPHQLYTVSRGTMVCIPVKLKSKEEKIFVIAPEDQKKMMTTSSYQKAGTDGVRDIEVYYDQEIVVTTSSIESPFVRISWKTEQGIVSWTDKITGREMLRSDRTYHAFTPVYEKTAVHDPGEMAPIRTLMGRNRKGMNAVRSSGRLTNSKIITSGKLFSVVELVYELSGASYFSLLLTVYAGIPRVDVAVRIHKDSVWEPENVYIALPFGEGFAPGELWIEKTGSSIRPRIDQLPGTGTDFYCVQEGVAYVSDKGSLSISMPDTPLIHLGLLEHHPILLQGHPKLNMNSGELYSWVLNNFWETNFKATVGGFYEFRYFLQWDHQGNDKEQAIQKCHVMNNGVLCFRTMDIGGFYESSPSPK